MRATSDRTRECESLRVTRIRGHPHDFSNDVLGAHCVRPEKPNRSICNVYYVLGPDWESLFSEEKWWHAPGPL